MDFFDPDGEPLVIPGALVKNLTRQRIGSKTLRVEACALICVIPPDLKAFVKRLRGEPVKAWQGFREVYRGYRGDKRVTIARAPFGAPGCVALAEELAAFGMQRALFVGYCGSLQPGMRAGDIICPTEAVREEGTSFHYLPADIPAKPHPDIQKLIVEHLRRHKVPYHEGKIWTTDAIYRETQGKVERYQKEGVLGVEMELAALFAFGMAQNVALGGMLVVTDELSTGQWHPRFLSPRLLKGVRRARTAAVEILGEMV
ncbi:MAG: nucleoside phosphorylase [Deltaproteobacteria bacterium]|nr:nucleoside phosphorylase [Deltaproteobacteria bacterium]